MVGGVRWYRRVASCWGHVVVIGSWGMLAAVPIVTAAIRLRRRAVWWLAAVYVAVDVALWVLADLLTLDSDGAVMLYGLVLVTVVGAGCVHVTRLRRELLALVVSPGVAVHRALMSVDVANSGDARRDTTAFVLFRRALFAALADAFEHSGITWSACTRHDTGDGMLVVVPPRFPKSRLVHPLLDRLTANLRDHNRYAAPAVRIRVRVAIHAGEVVPDDYGVTGRPKVLLARLLDAEPLRAALAAAPETATVAAIVSDQFYEDVVNQGHGGIDPGLYQPVPVRVKETHVLAWLHVPGHPPRAGEIGGTASSDAERRPRGV